MMKHCGFAVLSLVGLLMLVACGSAGGEAKILRLATTTSTYDSGLLQALLPSFEEQSEARVDVVAVGSGQALVVGENGDADVLLVHSPAQEMAFMEAGFGSARYPVMYNDFIIVGPETDPAGISGMTEAAQALARIAELQLPFVSRGDESGTHSRETTLWGKVGIVPDPEQGWYFSLGQGMAETLYFADEKVAYTLSDRGTFLALQDQLPELVILLGGYSLVENPDPALLNPYSVILVNVERYPQIQNDLAQDFAEWLTSLEVQQRIAEFGVEDYGQALFVPGSDAWRAEHPR